MKLFYADLSPYARKVRAVIEEKSLGQRVTAEAVNPYEIPKALSDANPLSKVPTLVLDDGTALYDSGVICEYLDAQTPGTRLLPADGEARWSALRRLALADGVIDAAFNVACELNRREEHERSARWVDHWVASIRRSLDALEAEVPEWPQSVDLAQLTTGCALEYLDVRLSKLLDWRDGHPRLVAWHENIAARPALATTRPQAQP